MIGKIQTWLATSALTLAIGAGVGAAGVLTWEHRTPFGLAHKLAGAQKDRDAKAADLRTCVGKRDAAVAMTWRWSESYARLAKARADDAAQAARRVGANAANAAARCSAAFDSGYAAGRSLNSGDPSHEPNPDPDAGGVAGAGGLRDDFAGAWRSGAVGHRPGG